MSSHGLAQLLHRRYRAFCVENGPLPGSNFDYGAALTEVALLGLLAQRFGGRIEYDAAAMRITNRPELNAHLRSPAREGWRYGESL